MKMPHTYLFSPYLSYRKRDKNYTTKNNKCGVHVKIKFKTPITNFEEEFYTVFVKYCSSTESQPFEFFFPFKSW